MLDGASVTEVDAFDLPEWLAQREITWVAETSIRGSHEVSGALIGGEEGFPCDLLAGDLAYPDTVLEEHWRRRVHQEWVLGQVLLVERRGRLTLALPGTEFTADRVLEGLARLAKAVGVRPSQFTASLRL